MLPFDTPLRLVLPPPISANNLFGNKPGKGRVVTKEYRAWKRSASCFLAAQGPFRQFTGPVEITYFVGERGIGMMDAGNVEKAPTDALVAAGVLRDDSRKWLRSVSAIWTERMSGIVAVIEPASPSAAGPDIMATLSRIGRELLA